MSVPLIFLVAVFFLGMGVYALARPTALTRPFGLIPDTSTARTEIRAVYGGFGVGMATLLLVAVVGPADVRPGILLTVAVALGSMAAGRLVSVALDTRTPWYPNWLYFLVELTGTAALLAAR